MAKLRVLFRPSISPSDDALTWNQITQTLADPARQVTDAGLDAVMDKLAAVWTI